MTRAEPLINSEKNSGNFANNNEAEDGQEAFQQGGSLRDAVTLAMANYLKQLDGQMATDVYPMVLAEIEAPLLTAIMEYTRNNQTKASIMLGLNRGTLRKKLKQYKLIAGDQD
ncbi:MAG: DNA-binding transcriptional regulator Fis [Halioglobus sp.]